jgi:Tol biopolymer transport system component
VSRLAVGGLVAVAGCGNVTVVDAAADGALSADRVASDASGAPDAAETADRAQDRLEAAVDQRLGPCDPNAAFGAPASLDDFNTAANDDAVVLSDDQLTALLSSDRPGGSGGYDLWVAVRSDVQARFSAATQVAGVNSADDERQPVLSSDSRHVYFMSNHGASGYRIVEATRNGVTGGFAPPAAVAGLDSGMGDISPWLSIDGAQIYLGSGRAGGLGGNDIYVADLSTAGASNVVDLAAVNSSADDASAVLSRDGLALYFASKRADATARGNDDIWVARRADVGDPFGAPAAVTELNTAAADGPRWLSPDGCTLYFVSDRSGGQGGYDLYSATRGR